MKAVGFVIAWETDMTTERCDYAIVGGGIAGLYCCLQLARAIEEGRPLPGSAAAPTAGQPVTIDLFERSDRLGGRIETWSMRLRRDSTRVVSEDGEGVSADRSDAEPAEFFRAEFGPMRIEPRDQEILADLLSFLSIIEQDTREPLDHHLVRFPAYASEQPTEPRFTLHGEEAEQSSLIDLLLLAMRRIFELAAEELDGDPSPPWTLRPDSNRPWRQFLGGSSVRHRYWKGELRDWIQSLTDDDYDHIRRHLRINRVHVYDMGFWNLLGEVLSHLAVVRIRDWGSYYHLLADNPNAAEWLVFWLRAMRSTNSLRGIHGGMEVLIRRIAERLEAYAPRVEHPRVRVRVHLSRRLTGLRPVKPHRPGEVATVALDFGADGVVKAAEVVLALPKQPLEKLPLPTVRRHLDGVIGIPLLKAFFVVDQPWWDESRKANTASGDLPTREIHYVTSRDRTKGMILVYTDRPGLQFWTEYVTDGFTPEGDYHRLTEQENALTWCLREGRILSEDQTGNPRLWRRFVQYARDYEHDDFNVDRLVAVGIRDWGKEPFGGACHAWKPGVKSWEVIREFTAFPLDAGGPAILHICGEAYSDYQGFIEGSLRSVGRVLEWYRSGTSADGFDASGFLRGWRLS